MGSAIVFSLVVERRFESSRKEINFFLSLPAFYSFWQKFFKDHLLGRIFERIFLIKTKNPPFFQVHECASERQNFAGPVTAGHSVARVPPDQLRPEGIAARECGHNLHG